MTDKTDKSMDKQMDKPMERAMRPSKEGDGLIPTLVSVGTQLAGKANETSFGLMRDLNAEVFTRISSAIDFVDETQQGTLRLLRKIVARIDQLSTAAMSASESVCSSLVRTSRDAGEGVVELSARASEAVSGKRAA